MADSQPFGTRVRALRRALDLTQEELARRVGCAGVTLRKVESGHLRASRQIAERLAVVLGVPPEEREAFVRAARAATVEPGERRQVFPASTPQLTPGEVGGDDLSGRVVRSYQLGERIGVGGFGAVYRAVQPGIERTVAMKLVLPRFADHPDFIRRFESEARLVARLEHPHIVPLYDYWRDPGYACLVMRYLRGGSLANQLAAGPLAPPEVLRVVEQIGAALAVAHRAGVVHRDLKPANILRDDDGNAFLADFGIAKELGANGSGQTAMVYLGSPAYSAPEQIRGEPVTVQSDLYAFGVLIFELLTGQQPFRGSTPAAVMRQQLERPLPRLADAGAALNGNLDAVLQHVTAKEPGNRYPNVASFVADVRAALAGLPETPASGGRVVAAPATLLLDLQPNDNPYKGLYAFDEADAAQFFGREALVHQLLSRLSERDDLARFLIVVGPSGSGKSSLVRAGLIPALRAGAVPGSEQWYIVDMLPGTEPLAELAAALRRLAPVAVEADDLRALLRADQRGLLRAARLVLPADDAELVLVIDQFEELFTLTASEEERVHLLESLVAAVLDERSRLRIVLTLRADFVDRPLQHVDFGELLKQRSELVLPLLPEELERAIVRPARYAGLELEEGLVATIIADAGAQPGMLPLLQHALSELFTRREGRLLTRAAYSASGGVAGALARSAEERYASLDQAGRDAAQQLFLRLVRPGEDGEDTRRRARRTELDAMGSAAAMEQALAAFGRSRLLTFDYDPSTREPTVEVAHEALLRAWPRLRGWVDAARADLRAQQQLAHAAAEWAQAGRDPSYLASGARLIQFASLGEGRAIRLNSAEQSYLDASLAAREAQGQAERERSERELRQAQALAETRRRSIQALRWFAGLLALAVLVSAGLGLYANAQRALADERTGQAVAAQAQADQRAQEAQAAQAQADQRARVAYAGELAALAQAALAEQPERSALLAVEAMGQLQADDPPSWIAEQALYDGIAALPPLRGFIGDGLAYFLFVKISPDGRKLVWGNVGSDNNEGPLFFWPLEDSVPGPIQTLDSFPGPVSTGVFHDNGLSVVMHEDRLIRWDLGGDAPVQTRFETLVLGAYITTQYLGPNAQALAAGTEEGALAVWDLAAGSAPDSLRTWQGHESWVEAVLFTSDENTLISASSDATVRVWDLRAADPAASGRVLPTGGEIVQLLKLSADNSTLVGASDRGNVWVWDLSAPDPAATARVIRTGQRKIVAFALSANGQTLATSTLGINVRVWNLRDPDPAASVRVLRGHDGEVYALALTPDGRTLVSGSADATARVWDLGASDLTASVRVLRGSQGFVNEVTLDDAANTLVTTSEGGELRVWPFGRERLLRWACRRAGRNLSWEEWQRYFGQQPYRRTCVEQPAHPSVEEAARELIAQGQSEAGEALLRHLRTLNP